MMEKPNKPLRVLLIEDVQTDADLLVRLLTRAGFAGEWTARKPCGRPWTRALGI
jgi:hypothetical protein